MSDYSTFEKRLAKFTSSIDPETRESMVAILGNETNYRSALYDFVNFMWQSDEPGINALCIYEASALMLAFVCGIGALMTPSSQFNTKFDPSHFVEEA